MLRVLNSSSKILIYEPSLCDFSDIIHRGIIDINLTEWYQQNDFNTLVAYPHVLSGLQSITQHRGYEFQIVKLLQVFDYS